MPKASSADVELDYEIHGPSDGEPLLLIRGLGTQRIQWPDGFLQALQARGFQPVSFDNRDVGRSTWLDQHPVPVPAEVIATRVSGQPASVPYHLEDMARDCVAVLDAAGIDRAHVFGMSLGGMIAQLVALHHAERTKSLTSLMSTTGAADLPGPSPEAAAALTEETERERGPYIEQWVRASRVFAGGGFPFDEAACREMAGRIYDRAFHPEGTGRQFAAVLAGDSRREQLAAITRPSLVIHGADDPLIPLAAGEDTARSIPGAELLVIPGMGHDLPPGVWEPIAEATARMASLAR
ncbi:MAG: alpha/beta hydrolase [Myxococcota bacterium]|nr:alpha/beta hydrolase [Myxococcota bacterium]